MFQGDVKLKGKDHSKYNGSSGDMKRCNQENLHWGKIEWDLEILKRAG